MIVAHAGADDLTAVLVVGAAAALVLAWRRWRAHRLWTTPLLGTFVLVLVAVGASRVKPSVPQARHRPRSTAAVAIVEPVDGTVTGPTVRVVVRLRGGHLVAATSRNLAPDQGHVHVLLDGKVLSSTARLIIVLRHVPRGRHVLQAEYVALDHGPFDPPVVSVATFSVA